jgi:hypothetical protein
MALPRRVVDRMLTEDPKWKKSRTLKDPPSLKPPQDPTSDIALPARTNALTDKLEETSPTLSINESADPNRANDLTEKELPTTDLPRRLTVPPSITSLWCRPPETLKEEPERTKWRTLRELPQCTKLRAEMELPSLANDLKLRAEPIAQGYLEYLENIIVIVKRYALIKCYLSDMN